MIYLVILVIIIIYVLYEDFYLKISKYNIKNSKIKKNIKIVHLSDYHSEKSKIINAQIINNIKEEKPDIIVFTGDSVGSGKLNTDVSLNFLKSVSKLAPLYYISGNHEIMVEDYDEYISKLLCYGVKVIDNKKVKLNDGMFIFGTKDPYFEHGKDSETVDNQLNDFTINENDYNILLSHRPELFDIYTKHKFDLTLCGHAHGGQFRLFKRGLYAPNQGIFPKLTGEMHTKNKSSIIISRGLGVFNAGFPIRINNRPELIVINLEEKNNE